MTTVIPLVKPGVIEINRDRLWQRHRELEKITEPDRPWTRVAFSDLHIQGRSWLREQMKEAGLKVHVDAGGNLIGRMSGRDDTLPPIASGSHSDTVPSGGRFDGIRLSDLKAVEKRQRLEHCENL